MRMLRALMILVMTVAFSGGAMLDRATAGSAAVDCHTPEHHDTTPSKAPAPLCKVCIGCTAAVAEPARAIVTLTPIGLHEAVYAVPTVRIDGLTLAPEPTPPRP